MYAGRVPTLFLLLCCYTSGVASGRAGALYSVFFITCATLLLAFYLVTAPSKTLVTIGAVSLFFHGYNSISDIATSQLKESDLSRITTEKVDFTGVMWRIPERVRFGERLYIKTEEIRRGATSYPFQLLIRVTCYNFLSGLEYGERVVIKNIRIRRPENFNNPGGFDYRQYLLDKGIELTGSIRDSEKIMALDRGSSLHVVALLYTLKKKLISFIEERSDPSVGNFLKTTSLGERGAVSPEVRDLFSKIGTSHTLAVSGLHVGFVAFLFYSIFKGVLSFLLLRLHIKSFMLGHTAKYAAAFTIPFVLVYVLMVGSSSSSFRAVVMGVVFLLSIIVGKEREIFSVIVLAAMILLLENPARLFEIGFQLSFSAVFFIAYGYRNVLVNEKEERGSVRQRKSVIMKLVVSGKNLLFISILAGLATAPLTAYYFNIVSIISPFSNMVVIPLLSIIIPSSLLLSLLSLFWKTGAEFLFTVPVELSRLLLELSRWVSKIPFGFFRVPSPDPSVVLFLLFLLTVVLIILKKIKGGVREFLLTTFAVFSVALFTFFLLSGPDPSKKEFLKVTFFDVGQGNSALIQTPLHRNILIDGGGLFGEFSLGRAVIAPFLWKRGITAIDYVIGTHQDKDHIGGLVYILREFHVKEYLDNGDRGEELTERILSILRRKNIEHRIISSGESIELPSGVKLGFLNPAKGRFENIDDNDRGLVIRVSLEEISLLFSGDISSKVEKRVAAGGNIKSTIMDAPHHGSRFSGSRSYINAISPEVVIISVGRKNPFGHPTRAALKRYLDSGAKIFRTDVNGAITVESDGRSFSVKAYL